MKTTVSRAILTLCAVALVAGAFAQQAGPRGQQRPGQEGPRQNMQQVMLEIHKKVLKELNLNEEQTTKIAELDKKRNEELTKLREEARNSQNREEFMQKQQAIQRKYQADLAAVLGPEKTRQYRTRTAEELRKWREANPGQGGPPPPARGGGGGGSAGGN